MPGTSGDIGAALEGVALDELLEVERAQWGNDPETYGERYLPTARLIFPEVGRIDIRTAVEAIRRENADGRAWAPIVWADHLPNSLKEKAIRRCRDLTTLFVLTRGWELNADLCRAVYETCEQLVAEGGEEREKRETMQAGVRVGLAQQKQCPPDIVVAVTWPTNRDRTTGWTGEQMMVAAELSRSWEGTFEELAAVVETG